MCNKLTPRLGRKYVAKVSMYNETYDVFELTGIIESTLGVLYEFIIHLRYDTTGELAIHYKMSEEVFQYNFIQLIE